MGADTSASCVTAPSFAAGCQANLCPHNTCAPRCLLRADSQMVGSWVGSTSVGDTMYWQGAGGRVIGRLAGYCRLALAVAMSTAARRLTTSVGGYTLAPCQYQLT